MTKNILIVDELHPILFDILDGKFVLDYRPKITFEEALAAIPNYIGLIIRSKFNVTKEFLYEAKKLKFIARAGAGVDNIDLDTALIRDIKILNASEANKDAVAEHTLGLLLSLLNNISISNYQIKHGRWLREANRGHEINGKTIGIIGYGNMGGAFANLLKDFNVRILAHDKYKQNFGNAHVTESPLSDILELADVISLHIPLTEETKYYGSEKLFNSLKKPVWLLNTSRGKIIKTDALIKAINSGKILGAALDVLEEEPPKQASWFKDLVDNDKILLSPHVAGWSHESYKKISQVIAKKIIELYSY